MTHPSQFALDRHALGESTPEVAAHLEGCDACRRRLQSQKGADAVFLARHPAPRESAVGRFRGLIAAVGTFGAVAAGVMLYLRTPQSPLDDGVRAKGGQEVQVFVDRGAERFGFAAQVLHRDDRVSIRVNSKYGHATAIVAEAEGTSSVLVDHQDLRGTAPRLKNRLRLDDYTGREFLLVCLSDAPVDADSIRKKVDALREGGKLSSLDALDVPCKPHVFSWSKAALPTP